MKLLPDEMERSLPPLYSQESLGLGALARVKFFTPDGSWTWFASEYDPSQRLFFGLVVGFEAELGYFSLDELEEARGGLGLPIERDLSFKPKPLSECKKGIQ